MATSDGVSDQVSGDTGTEAAPCPFCGAPHAKVSPAQEHRGPGWAVRCERCLAQGPAHEAGSAALALWNEAARALAPEPSGVPPEVAVWQAGILPAGAPSTPVEMCVCGEGTLVACKASGCRATTEVERVAREVVQAWRDYFLSSGGSVLALEKAIQKLDRLSGATPRGAQEDAS